MATIPVVIQGVEYNSAPVTNGIISSQSNGSIITDITYNDYNQPIFHGIGDPNSSVYLLSTQFFYAAGSYHASATVSPDGSWSVQEPLELSSGFYNYHVSQYLQPGRISTFLSNSDNFNLTVVSQKSPVISEIISNSTGSENVVSSYSTTSDTTPTIKGTAEPGSVVYIYDNGVKIGETSTGSAASENNPSWSWSFTPTQPLSTDQTHVFTVESRNLNLSDISMETTPSDYSYTIGIGVTPALPDLLAPVITSVVDDVGVNQGAVADGGQTNDTRPTLHGTSEPGTVVTVSDNGHVIGTATTGADWQWTFTPSTDLAAGASTLSVSAARADGTGSVAAWYTHGLDVTPSLDAVLATAGLSAAPAPAASAPTVQAAYVVSEAATAAVLPQHDLAY